MFNDYISRQNPVLHAPKPSQIHKSVSKKKNQPHADHMPTRTKRKTNHMPTRQAQKETLFTKEEPSKTYSNTSIKILQ